MSSRERSEQRRRSMHTATQPTHKRKNETHRSAVQRLTDGLSWKMETVLIARLRSWKDSECGGALVGGSLSRDSSHVRLHSTRLVTRVETLESRELPFRTCCWDSGVNLNSFQNLIVIYVETLGFATRELPVFVLVSVVTA